MLRRNWVGHRMYLLIIAPRAKKQLKELKKVDEIPIKSALEEIKEEPLLLGKSLGRDLNNRLSYRFGVYRIIYKVNQKDQIVEILSAGHRGTVYN